MAIIIYTYSNPYKIDKEPYWPLIKGSLHLCVSQTLANGLCDQYGKDFYKGKLTTITRFLNCLYDEWESDAVEINQRAIIDNLIDYMNFDIIADNSISLKDIRISLKRNRVYVLNSIRIMFELGMDPAHIKVSELTYEQKCVVAIYKELHSTHNRFFQLKNDFTEEEINIAMFKTMKEALDVAYPDGEKKEMLREELRNVKKDVIVVHGIHQFSPLMLKAIEILSKYKNVIILFNYVPDYKNVCII